MTESNDDDDGTFGETGSFFCIAYMVPHVDVVDPFPVTLSRSLL